MKKYGTFIKFSEAYDAVSHDIYAQLIQIVLDISRVTRIQNWLQSHKKILINHKWKWKIPKKTKLAI